MFDSRHDLRVRQAAFEWLKEETSRVGDVVSRTSIAEGFVFEGRRVPLVGPSGIFKPAVLDEVPLSITTSANTTYNDYFGPDKLLRYSYRSGRVDHSDNRGLKAALERRLPLIYFHCLAPNKYLAAWPVYVVQDHPAQRQVTVAVDEMQFASRGLEASLEEALSDDGKDPRRRYATATMKVRLHQRAFRERVLEAYKRQCALCRFKHEEMLDAAHIVPDSEPDGEPKISNGLALCSLHHAAFDKYFLAITPEYRVEVRKDIMTERDGPTLSGIQSLQGKQIWLPKKQEQRPLQVFLQQRLDKFLAAAASKGISSALATPDTASNSPTP